MTSEHHSHETLSEMDKLTHLLGHWQEHNKEHEANYRKWADTAASKGKAETAELLRQAAEATSRITDLFARALSALD